MTTNKSQKTWLDQPDEVMNAAIKLHFHTGEHSVEVRALEEPDVYNEPHIQRTFYVTTGTLFGSQTIKVYGTEVLLSVLNLAAKTRRKEPAKLPANCELLDNVSS